ncbi:MAG: ankyrin repeat domain-containing protein [Lamprobacter sp.]|uniref:ankyrin repeat domain-containing protein n=1 Tax=Lamprobacter sp. TaxID=3100796 RepID=UPI002B25E9E3|nr:ankyrin repeat domain-containing protein [Lamprobacter sp.]MEA3640836.1 ankyrin repeat domain-containing protein [Lamprobacter sp.]
MQPNNMLRIRFSVVLLLLVLAGCSNAPDPESQAEALLSGAETGDVSTIERLLGERADANARNSCDWTPLMMAAVNGHADAVERLLAAGAEVDAVDQGGYTALLLATSNNHTQVMKQLLDQGAMIDAKEQTQGYTPLIWAAHRGHQQAVALLLERGADTTLPDFDGKTAADHAREEGHEETLALLR